MKFIYFTDTTPSKPSAPLRTDPGMDRTHKDNSFREFRRLCANVADEPSYLSKTEIISNFFKNGSSKDSGGFSYVYENIRINKVSVCKIPQYTCCKLNLSVHIYGWVRDRDLHYDWSDKVGEGCHEDCLSVNLTVQKTLLR